MSLPPVEHRSISKADLARKYHEDGWEQRLASYKCLRDDRWEPVTGGPTIKKRSKKYLDDEGTTIAFMIEYLRADGTTHLAVRMLLIDGVAWDAHDY